MSLRWTTEQGYEIRVGNKPGARWWWSAYDPNGRRIGYERRCESRGKAVEAAERSVADDLAQHQAA